MSDVIKSLSQLTQKTSTSPSANSTSKGTAGLPQRTGGAIAEVLYDHNGPKGTDKVTK